MYVLWHEEEVSLWAIAMNRWAISPNLVLELKSTPGRGDRGMDIDRIFDRLRNYNRKRCALTSVRCSPSILAIEVKNLCKH